MKGVKSKRELSVLAEICRREERNGRRTALCILGLEEDDITCLVIVLDTAEDNSRNGHCEEVTEATANPRKLVDCRTYHRQLHGPICAIENKYGCSTQQARSQTGRLLNSK